MQPLNTERTLAEKQRLFTRACSGWTRDNGFKLEVSRFKLDIRKNSLDEGSETLEQVVRGVVDIPAWEVLKTRLERAWRNLVW